MSSRIIRDKDFFWLLQKNKSRHGINKNTDFIYSPKKFVEEVEVVSSEKELTDEEEMALIFEMSREEYFEYRNKKYKKAN